MSLCTVPPQQLLQKSLQTMHKSVGNHIRTSSPSSLPCSPTTIAHSFGSKGQINGSSGEIFVLICSMDGFKPGMCHYPSAAPYFSSHFVTAAFPFGHARHISFRQKYLRGFMRNSSQRRLTLTLGAAQRRRQSRNMCTQKKQATLLEFTMFYLTSGVVAHYYDQGCWKQGGRGDNCPSPLLMKIN